MSTSTAAQTATVQPHGVDSLRSGGRTYAAAPVAVLGHHAHVARNFGAPNGTAITNAATVMHDLYRALGHHRPPKLIGIFVEPYNNVVHTDAAGVGLNPFGHAAIAYTLDGVTRVMNISGSDTTPMVNFMTLEEYLFGVNNFETGNEQGGIYNRTFRLMCVWDWPDKGVQAIHNFYTRLAARARRKEARFSQVVSHVLNLWPGKTRWGNCAMWTSEGLVAAGMFKRPTMWPKQVVIKMLENIAPDNMTCVWLPRVAHARLSFGFGAGQRGMVAPCRLYRNCAYWNLGRRAQATVSVPPNSMAARPYVL